MDEAAPAADADRRAPEPTGAADADPDTSPIRQRRPFTIAAELGLNSLAGAGVVFGWTPGAHIGLALGSGWNPRGFRIGGQLRGLLLQAHATPYAGLGFNFDFGNQGSYYGTDDDGDTVTVGAGPSLELVVGTSWVTEAGFSLTSTAGYAFALSSHAGLTNSDLFSQFFTGSGPVLGLAVGFAF